MPPNQTIHSLSGPNLIFRFVSVLHVRLNWIEGAVEQGWWIVLSGLPFSNVTGSLWSTTDYNTSKHVPILPFNNAELITLIGHKHEKTLLTLLIFIFSHERINFLNFVTFPYFQILITSFLPCFLILLYNRPPYWLPDIHHKQTICTLRRINFLTILQLKFIRKFIKFGLEFLGANGR